MRALFVSTLALTFALLGVACWVAPWPHAPIPPNVPEGEIISPTIYLPHVHHFSVASCRTMFPPEDVGSLCDYYDGIDLPDLCGRGYHLEAQNFERPIPRGAFASETAAVHRKVCHLDDARGERGVGVTCETKGTP